MRIVLLCSAQPNQMALANKIAGEFGLVGIVLEKKTAGKKKRYAIKTILSRISDRLLFSPIHNTWARLMSHYKKVFNTFPPVPTIEVNQINHEDTRRFILECQPDLVMVSGTSLLKHPILSIPIPNGIINLHTGLSPYVKGGPNCTNWCIADGQFHLIGNTVMWIDAGIDSGDLIGTALVQFDGNETFFDIHLKVMEEAHALYLRSVRAIEMSTAGRIRQDSIGQGTVYYTKDWGPRAKRRLLRNLKKFKKTVTGKEYIQKLNKVITVKCSWD